MEKEKVKKLLRKVRAKKIDINEAFLELQHLPYEDLGFAKVDHFRSIRSGFPEVIFCQGKTEKQIVEIFKTMKRKSTHILLTRANEKIFSKISDICKHAVFHKEARAISYSRVKRKKQGKVAVISAGTADIPVAEEAAITAEVFGSYVVKHFDVGVAGIHRLIHCFQKIYDSRCIIVVAGMDGALPSVIGGLSASPVIAVPTSVGYGSHFKGLASLLTMLNSCAPNVAVVNIDNGFGAGYLAAQINRMKN